MARIPQPYKVGPWTSGIKNTSNPLDLTNRELWDSENLDITDKGKLRTRWDAEQVYAGTGVHSLYPGPMLDFFVESDGLKSMKLDDTVDSVTALTDVTAPMSYAYEIGRLYYTNGTDIGICDNRFISRAPVAYPIGYTAVTGSWSVEALSTGTTPPGTYLVAIGYVGSDGRLSSIVEYQKVVVADGQGILISDIPSPADAAEMLIYVSGANASDLYLANQLPVGTTEWSYTGKPRQGPVLSTMGLEPLPPGSIIRRHASRTFVASGNMLVWSELDDFGLYRPEANIMIMEAEITILQPVDNGLFIVAGDVTYFLSGTDPDKFAMEEVYPYGATPGTGMEVHGDMFHEERKLPNQLAFWYSDTGCIIGSNGGKLLPLMEDRAVDGKYQVGAPFITKRKGVVQVGAAVRGKVENSGLQVSERVIVTVRKKNRRHGVRP